MAQQAHFAPDRWLRLMPMIFVSYSFAFVDRANYGFGAAAGMAHDLHITAGVSAFLGSLFFLGYFLFQIPGATSLIIAMMLTIAVRVPKAALQFLQ